MYPTVKDLQKILGDPRDSFVVSCDMNAGFAPAPQGRGDEHHPQRLSRALLESGGLDDLGVDERELDKELQRRPYTNDGENLD